MNIKLGIMILLGMLASTTVYAADESQDVFDPWYYGFKVGFLDPDVGDSDPAINGGAFVGYRFQNLEGFAVEADATVTVIDGEINNRDFDAIQLGAFGVWRSSGDIYFKGKGGVMLFDLDGGLNNNNSTETELGLGAGVGFPINRGQDAIEVELVITNDINFLTVGYRFE